MGAKLSREDFGALVRRAGVALSTAETDELHGVWANVEPMLDRIRAATRGREAEPALIYRAEEVMPETGA